jgi:HPt (histidine-containing phosphotransfer) domain-containing protein
MDLQMPEMDGIEATKRIRADARFAKLPIIAMTAHAMVEERERCSAAGMVDHITKPIDPHSMFQILARWVRGSAPAAPRPAAKAEDGLPQVDGLDTAAGLKRVAGNRKLYLSLLRQFAEKQADAGRRLAAALAEKDREGAERIAHSVKGVAGNIGLAALGAAAASVEQALKTQKGLKAAATDFEAQLARAVAGLNDALRRRRRGRHGPVATPPRPRPENRRPPRQQRRRAVDTCSHYGAELRGIFQWRLRRVRAGGQQFEFDTALDSAARRRRARHQPGSPREGKRMSETLNFDKPTVLIVDDTAEA